MTAAALIAIISFFAFHSFGGRLIYAGTYNQAEKFFAEFFDTFDTVVTFTAFAKDRSEFDAYLNIVHGEMTRLHRMFDIYSSYEGLNNMRTINEAAGTASVKVDPDIVELLETAKTAYADTNGAVNIALGPVLSIWHDCRKRALINSTDISAPSYEELNAASKHISPYDIEIDRENFTVRLRYSGMSLDVGAIGKGFAAQKTVEAVRKAGLESGLLNAGGNVIVIGPPLDGREAWNIGIHTPTEDGDRSKLFDVVYLAEGSAVTSGNDQRYFVVDGKRYHHIINPETLFPAESVRSVTVLHPDSAAADILSTAAFILRLEEARQMIERHGAEAVWITQDWKTVATDGYLRLSKTGRENTGRTGSASKTGGDKFQ
ncbi:MAG: FAD:protein FMN transferase [Synergistaceae bacterium]|nr:FAD:protein FMN transferase [Synergistaceae bacterium]